MIRKKIKCENCGKEISCSNYERHLNSCKNKKFHNIVKQEWLKENNKYQCPYCELEFSKYGIGIHIWSKHTEEGQNKCKNQKPCLGKTSWLKGKNLPQDYKDKISESLKGKPGRSLTEEEKSKISGALKKSHSENRHPGWTHINSDINRRSYPEKFMIEVFQNNGLYDKFTIIEKMPFSKYFLDFAFIDLKLCIEVDGSQHYRTLKAIEHDKIRDEFLIENGWLIYRINWQYFSVNTRSEIEKLIEYINALST
jgi:very-short-patch-repair endonuclease